MTVAQIEDHVCLQPCPQCGDLLTLPQNRGDHPLVCPNVPVACTYANVGCTHQPSRKALALHLEHGVAHHLQLLHDRVAKQQQMGTPTGLCQSERTYRDLYDRVVSLEQTVCHQAIQQEEAMRRWQRAQFCHGRYVWRIKSFSSHLTQMRASPRTYLLYSPPFYTDPVMGYKVCLRVSLHVSSSAEPFLGVFLHLMRGPDDDLLDFPFAGRIVLTLKHGRERGKDFSETMMASQPSLAAFEKVLTGARNPVGFGLQQFVSVRSLLDEGFCDAAGQDEVVIVALVVSSLN